MQELSVTALVRYLKNKIDTDNNLQKLTVKGEISNFHHHFSGHLYFTLKDENAQINCVMFKSQATTLKFIPKNGDKVLLLANTSIFESSGQLQLYVSKMSLAGLGDLYAQYELLKNKLFEEGYFDDNHKKQLDVSYISNVAVLVGDKSAAMSDIKTTFLRRWPLVNIVFYPVLVQGESAPDSIVNKLIEVDSLEYDAIILARGGGSFEDLFCFNNEKLVKTIYALKTFIVTGVGHEQDYTLVDFVADLRAPTPTAAVELITPDINDVITEIDSLTSSLHECINSKLNINSMRCDLLITRLNSYSNVIDKLNSMIDSYVTLMNRNIKSTLTDFRTVLSYKMNVALNNLNHKLESNILHLKRFSTLLEAYNYQNVLAKGYTYVRQDNRLIKKITDLKDKYFELTFIDGKIIAERRK